MTKLTEYIVVVVQLQCCVQFFATPWAVAHQASLSLTISRSLPKFMSIELLMLSNHLLLFHPLFLLPSVFSRISLFPMNGLFTSGGQSINTPFLQLHNIRAFHYQRNGHELGQTPGDGGGQGGLACCSPWGCKESDTTEQLNNNKNQ